MQRPPRELNAQIAGIKHAHAPYCYRCPFGLEHPSCGLKCAKDIEELIQTTTEDDWPLPGESFQGFSLLESLGKGAFSRVFLAAEPDLGDRKVVVKVSLQDTVSIRYFRIVPVDTAIVGVAPQQAARARQRASLASNRRRGR